MFVFGKVDSSFIFKSEEEQIRKTRDKEIKPREKIREHKRKLENKIEIKIK